MYLNIIFFWAEWLMPSNNVKLAHVNVKHFRIVGVFETVISFRTYIYRAHQRSIPYRIWL